MTDDKNKERSGRPSHTPHNDKNRWTAVLISLAVMVIIELSIGGFSIHVNNKIGRNAENIAATMALQHAQREFLVSMIQAQDKIINNELKHIRDGQETIQKQLDRLAGDVVVYGKEKRR